MIRSILAVALAVLVLAAEAPGLFVESPVCAAVDGVGAISRVSKAKTTPSCCGSATCPMHASGCGKAESCPMASQADENRGSVRETPGSNAKHALCASTCGGESVRVMPGVPDPGTLELPDAGAILADAASVSSTCKELPNRDLTPATPPPRA